MSSNTDKMTKKELPAAKLSLGEPLSWHQVNNTWQSWHESMINLQSQVFYKLWYIPWHGLIIKMHLSWISKVIEIMTTFHPYMPCPRVMSLALMVIRFNTVCTFLNIWNLCRQRVESYKLISDLKELYLWTCMLVGSRNIKNGTATFLLPLWQLCQVMTFLNKRETGQTPAGYFKWSVCVFNFNFKHLWPCHGIRILSF